MRLPKLLCSGEQRRPPGSSVALQALLLAPAQAQQAATLAAHNRAPLPLLPAYA